MRNRRGIYGPAQNPERCDILGCLMRDSRGMHETYAVPSEVMRSLEGVYGPPTGSTTVRTPSSCSWGGNLENLGGFMRNAWGRRSKEPCAIPQRRLRRHCSTPSEMLDPGNAHGENICQGSISRFRCVCVDYVRR